MRLHPGLSALYARKVADLSASLADPQIRTMALATIRGLITQITLRETTEGVRMEIEGALAAMIGLAQPEALRGTDLGSVKVVAGAGSQKFSPIIFQGSLPRVCDRTAPTGQAVYQSR